MGKYIADSTTKGTVKFTPLGQADPVAIRELRQGHGQL